MRRFLFVLVVLCFAQASCRGKVAPQPSCPEPMLLLGGGSYVLGEGPLPERISFDSKAVILRRTFQIDSFCIEPLPFPGVEGAPWPNSGLSALQAQALDAKVESFGRRLCSISELLLAAAGPENWRFPYDPQERIEGTCDPDDSSPKPLGSHPDCVSPLGVRDFQVRSSWGRLGTPLYQHVAFSGGLQPLFTERHLPLEFIGYAVFGGASRSDTFYSPNNFGLHGHPKSVSHLDDAVRLCANPASSWPHEDAYRQWLAPALLGEDIFPKVAAD